MTPNANTATKRVKKPATQPKAPAAKRAGQDENGAATVPAAITKSVATQHGRELSQVQELIIDTLGDLITNGGHADERRWLVWAALSHYERRFWSDASFSAKQMDERADKFIRDHVDEWEADLTVQWKLNRKAPAEEKIELRTVSERLRANVRDDLKDRFQSFLNESSPEEARFLRDVLMTWQSSASHPDHLMTEVHLADAFFGELGESANYVRVPHQFIGTVEKYAI